MLHHIIVLQKCWVQFVFSLPNLLPYLHNFRWVCFLRSIVAPPRLGMKLLCWRNRNIAVYRRSKKSTTRSSSQQCRFSSLDSDHLYTVVSLSEWMFQHSLWIFRLYLWQLTFVVGGRHGCKPLLVCIKSRKKFDQRWTGLRWLEVLVFINAHQRASLCRRSFHCFHRFHRMFNGHSVIIVLLVVRMNFAAMCVVVVDFELQNFPTQFLFPLFVR